ncbi:MAG: glutamate formimidoyltransferase [Defluviitaleaceae bacterium]|nr:glutamate formimidoyltransferase [Defluviitaleaceae bacterium]
MTKIIECIPNFSEGRNEAVIEGLAAIAKSTPGVTLLDYSADTSHNRSVFTLIGDLDGIKSAVIALAKYAVEHIDLTKHEGEHPRMGAVDVIPFVPIKGVAMEECVALSKEVGEAIATQVGIPVFLYESSASAPGRTNLAAIRKGQFEGMAAKMEKSEWKPDYGDSAPHPTAGVVAVGARMPLVAFNVNLSTSDVNIANNIAKIIRGSSGGLKYCKAIGILLEDRNIAQVSMNMVNYEGTPLYRAVELIKAEAKRYGVHVTGTELIGLAPAKALIDCAEYYMQLEAFDYNRQVLENHLF